MSPRYAVFTLDVYINLSEEQKRPQACSPYKYSREKDHFWQNEFFSSNLYVDQVAFAATKIRPVAALLSDNRLKAT